MIISGIDRIFINVPDLEKGLGFYQDIVGMEVVTKVDIDYAILEDLWGLSRGIKGRSACLKNKKQPTLIELVELQPAPKESARDGRKTYDYGPFDVCFLVSDAMKVEKMLKKRGYQFLTRPTRYPPFPSGEEASEGFVYGPANELVAILQFFNPIPSDAQRLDGDFWTMLDVAQVVDDMDRAFSFYRDALGLVVLSDNTQVPAGFLDTALHLPQNTKPHMAMVNHLQSKGPAVELLDLSAKGEAIDSSPEKLGIFLISFESSDLDGDLSLVKGQGFRVISGPVQVEAPLHGKVKAAGVEGPSNIRVELFQKLYK